MERGNNLVDDPLSLERCFFLATASSRPRHDWILEYALPFFDYYYFFSFIIPSTKHLIRYPTLALATRHDTIRYIFFLSFFFSFFLELKMEILNTL